MSDEGEMGDKISIRLPTEYLKMLDILVDLKDSSSRSEAIRLAIRDYLYTRVPMLHETMKKMQETRRALASMDEMRKTYLKE